MKLSKDTVEDNLPWPLVATLLIAFLAAAAIGCIFNPRNKEAMKPLYIVKPALSNAIPADLVICRDTNEPIDWRNHK